MQRHATQFHTGGTTLHQSRTQHQQRRIGVWLGKYVRAMAAAWQPQTMKSYISRKFPLTTRNNV
ncbi:MAG: hypothetical protein ABI870_03580 [Rhodanobacter sp.]